MARIIKGLAGRQPPQPSSDRSDIDGWLRDMHLRLRPIVNDVDELISTTIPGLQYAFKAYRPYYWSPNHGWIIQLAAYQRSVNVLFFGGADFDNPPPLGDVDRTRYVNLTTLDEARRPELRRWVEQARRTPGWT